jgi:hypothetical protein
MSATALVGIREAIRAAWVRPVAGGLSAQARFSDACGAVAEVTDLLWDVEQFRPCEQEDWDALRSAATTRVQQVAEAALLEGLAEALATFAAAYPDAPRVGPDDDL